MEALQQRATAGGRARLLVPHHKISWKRPFGVMSNSDWPSCKLCRELGDRMEALQQHASAGGRSRLLVLQARLLQRSGAVQSGATSAGEQDPPALLRAALDVAAEVRVILEHELLSAMRGEIICIGWHCVQRGPTGSARSCTAGVRSSASIFIKVLKHTAPHCLNPFHREAGINVPMCTLNP